MTLACSVLAGCVLAGCAVVGPDYQPIEPSLPSAWVAPRPHGGSTADLVDWWRRFDDPRVATLVSWAEDDSPSLAQAAARIDSARATLASSQGAAAPSLSGNGSLARARQAGLGVDTATATSRSGGLDASWEIDLFGKIRRTNEAAQARLEARSADWHAARVSLAGEVADHYVQFRACRLLQQQYALEVASQRETARVTAEAVQAGLSAPADSDLGEAGLANAQSTLVEQGATCDSLVKSLVALTGADEALLRGSIEDGPALPMPAGFEVTAVPAGLVRQRPDVVAGERELAAASADIGKTEADRYPSLSLGGFITLSASSLASSGSTWSFGPSLTLPLLDGGRRRAAVNAAVASYDEAFAAYRETVRSAVKEVEQALVSLDGAARRGADARRAAEHYRRYFLSTEVNWRAGGVDLLSLEIARRSALTAQTTLLTLQRDQVRAWIALYKSLGGGWTAESLPASMARADTK